MGRKEILSILSEHKKEIETRFNVDTIAIFGSAARDEIGPESDVDVLVSFRTTPGIFRFLELKQYLEGILQEPVDLATEKALKDPLRPQILKEAVRA